jgi:hypothetical protein
MDIAITSGLLVGMSSLAIGATMMLRVVRVRGRGKPVWHLLVASSRDIDLSTYPPRAVQLARAAGLWWRGGMICLAVAGLLKVLVESQLLPH